MVPVIPERVALLSEVTLRHGAHQRYEDGACVMETVAHIAGEPHSDRPACACPVVSSFARSLNDRIPDDPTRTRLLLPLVLDIAGSKSTLEVEIRRGYVAADFAVRVFAPIALEARGRKDLADRLRAVAPIVDRDSAKAAKTETDAAYKIAAAAAADTAAAAAYAAAAYADTAAAAAYAAYAAADTAAAAADADAARLGVYEKSVKCLRAMLAVR